MVKITVSWDETRLNWVDSYNSAEVTHNMVTHKLLPWLSYVDNTFVPWPHGEKLKDFLDF